MANFPCILLAKKWDGDVQNYSFSEWIEYTNQKMDNKFKMTKVQITYWIEMLLNPYLS